MKIFETVQKHLLLLGISPNERAHPFNWKIVMCFLMFGLSILLNVIFIFSGESIILMNYVEFFCVITGLIELGICLLAIVLQQMKLFEVIKTTEKLINESNLNLFEKWNLKKKKVIKFKFFKD